MRLFNDSWCIWILKYLKNHNNIFLINRRIVNGTKLRFHDLRHVFATWLHKAGVSLDVVRPLLGHRDRKTTDGYVTYNRLYYSDVLNAIPRINRNTKKETPKTLKSKSLLIKNGTNWHAGAKDYMSFVPGKAVSN